MSGDIEMMLQVASETGAERAIKQFLSSGVVTGTGPLLYSTEGAATVLGCSGARVRELIRAGVLETIDGPGRGAQITRKVLEAYVDRLVADKNRATRSLRAAS